MKKLSARAISSSPARTDKFPPPLMMRFLRTNAGSRSTRRTSSRSSPMFLRKKNTTTTVETQEPSSPKVTCMGQVRAKRSSKSTPPKRETRASSATPCRCWWIRKPNNPCRCRPVWPKWAFFRRKSTKLKEENSAKSESNFQGRSFEEESRMSTCDNVPFASISSTPPRNALLLTRCRSAPFRSSSLASKFWGSEETESTSGDTSGDNDNKPVSVRHSVSESEAKRVSESETKMEFFKELEDSLLRQGITASITNNSEGNSASRSPVVLTRCKSEPANRGLRIDPEVNNLWKKRRLGFATETCSVLHHHMVSD
ncbi:uncharacterized protein LOC130730374 [Lotus japonicus]|uniref:uncharacterized protein LOC130730374 n=1 Tax=Lotus japonicus TaxID=34305 RepID=UPI0025844346|nr:uncharacterized protein LOC130730374 [Lotus japonicus]